MLAKVRQNWNNLAYFSAKFFDIHFLCFVRLYQKHGFWWSKISVELVPSAFFCIFAFGKCLIFRFSLGRNFFRWSHSNSIFSEMVWDNSMKIHQYIVRCQGYIHIKLQLIIVTSGWDIHVQKCVTSLADPVYTEQHQEFDNNSCNSSKSNYGLLCADLEARMVPLCHAAPSLRRKLVGRDSFRFFLP